MSRRAHNWVGVRKREPLEKSGRGESWKTQLQSGVSKQGQELKKGAFVN